MWRGWCVCLAAVTLIHLGEAAVFRQTPYVYDGSGNKLRFVAKFGIHGNAQVRFFGMFENTTAPTKNESVTIAFVPHETWTELNRKLIPSNDCSQLSNQTLNVPYTCRVSAGVCIHTVTTHNVTAAYWYLIILGCAEPHWLDSGQTQFDYTVTLTNLHSNVLSEQFSYDMEGVVIILMVSTFTYLALLAFQLAFSFYDCCCLKHRQHLMVKLFNILLLLELAGQGFQLVHLGLYTSNGVGIAPLGHVGAGLAVASDCVLVLLFFLISEGWQLTKAILHNKLVICALWGLFVLFSCIFFAWMVVYPEVHPDCTENFYQTWAAWLYQSYRILILPYLLYRLWHTYQQENNHLVMNVYRLLAVGFVVWFGYLPIIVLVLYLVNTLEWTRVILSTSLFFDLAANFVLVILFCPLWSDYYFQFNSHLNTLVGARRKYTELKRYQ